MKQQILCTEYRFRHAFSYQFVRSEAHPVRDSSGHGIHGSALFQRAICSYHRSALFTRFNNKHAAAHSADYSVSHWEKIRCSTRERQEFAHHAAVLDYCFHNLRSAVGFCRADALSEYRRRWIFLFGGTQRSLRRKAVAAVGKPGNYGNAVFCQLTAHMSGHFFSVIRTPSCADYCKRRFGLQSCAFASCIKHKRRIRNIFQFGRISFTVRRQC